MISSDRHRNRWFEQLLRRTAVVFFIYVEYHAAQPLHGCFIKRRGKTLGEHSQANIKGREDPIAILLHAGDDFFLPRAQEF